MKDIVDDILQDSLKVKEQFIRECGDDLITLAKKIVASFTSDRKLLICGNGGSAANAQHISSEFINRFEMERPPLPAISLSTDTSVITYIGNDCSFNDIFTKQIKAIGLEGDVLLAISTTGNSQNVISAAETARDMGIFVAGLTGGKGGKLKDLCDFCLIVPSDRKARIQETHILAGHIICRLVDYILFQGGDE
ncbi:MAG: SIS domain-containing protein [Deltaproteobacteria bacterium]|nr:SIS domain-containing protein [Deltaproteobacteria bacterium]